ncbi:MAG: hypothetical protein P9D89_02530 [Candidatus Contendobacter sp.]|nr:hypothetical protein [Candidatus Contendobacter sp.]
MKTSIAASSAFAVIVGLSGITPTVAESFNDQRPDSEDWASARQASVVYPSEGGQAELPAAQTQNGITFVTGGIGKPEASAMKAAAQRYDLMLVFADHGGHYLADVNVKIKDRAGNTVLDIVSDPILLANLPAGRYTLQAAGPDGKMLVKTINLTSKRPVQLVYHWPTDFKGSV